MPTVDEFLRQHGSKLVDSEAPPQAPVGLGITPPQPLPPGTTLPPAEPPAPLGQQIKESILGPGQTLGPQPMGEIIGGSLGTAAIPVMGPAGPIVGAGLGGMFGKGMEILWEGKPKTKAEFLQEVGWAGATGAGTQYLGGKAGDWLVEGAQKAMAPMAEKIERSRRDLNKVYDQLGISKSAGQASGKSWLQRLERGTSHYAFGVGPAEKFAETQVKEMEKSVSDLIEQVNPGYNLAAQEVGKALKSGSEKALEAAKDYSRFLYDGIEDVVSPKKLFPTENLYNISKVITKEEQLLRGKLGNPATATAEQVKQMTAPIPGMGALLDPASIPAAIIQEFNLATKEAAQMPFARIRAIQSRLGNLATNHPNAEARRTFARMLGGLMEDMDKISDQTPGLADKLSMANEFYKNRIIKDFVKNDTFHDIKEKDASLLSGFLFGPRTSLEQVERVKKVIPKDVYEQLKAGWLLDLVETRSQNELGKFSPEMFTRNLAPKNYRPEVIKAIVGKDTAEAISKIREVFLDIQASKIGAGNPQLNLHSNMNRRYLEDIRKFIGPGVTSIATGGGLFAMGINPIYAAAFTGLLPLTMAKVLFSPKGAKWLSEGLTLQKRKATYEAGRIPTMIALGRQDWPFPADEVQQMLDNPEMTFPPLQNIEPNPLEGVKVEVPPTQPQAPMQPTPLKAPPPGVKLY